MAKLIHEHETHVRTPHGDTYVARTYAEEERGGTWVGWIEFVPLSGRGPTLRTARETTQPSLDAVAYWASGLEPVYLEGAFERARTERRTLRRPRPIVRVR